MIIATAVFLPVKDRKSDPNPTFAQYLIGIGIGSVILVSSTGCFFLAVRLMRGIPSARPPSDVSLQDTRAGRGDDRSVS